MRCVVSAAAWGGRSRAVGHTNKVPPHQVLLTVPSSGPWASSRTAPSAPSQQHLQTGVPLSNCPAAGGCAKGGPVRLRDNTGVGTAGSASHSSRDTSGGLGLHAAGGAWGVWRARCCVHWRRGSQGQPRSSRPETWLGWGWAKKSRMRASSAPGTCQGRKRAPQRNPRPCQEPGTNPVIVSPPAPTIFARNGCPNTSDAAKLFGTGGLTSRTEVPAIISLDGLVTVPDLVPMSAR